MLKGKLTYASLIAMFLVSVLQLEEKQALDVANAILIIIPFLTGLYGRWRATKRYVRP